MNCNKLSIFNFVLLVSFPPSNGGMVALSFHRICCQKSPLSKGVIANSMSFLHNVIAPIMLGMFDVGYVKASAFKVGTHTRVFMNSS